MRIISGIYGGRRFETPRHLPARPTTDMARESLFNILANRVDFEGIHALDLFAGTGAIGFEMLSQGAGLVVSVEQGVVQQSFIQRVHDTLRLGDSHRLVRGDVFRYVAACRESFDLIFADPPYDLPERTTLPRLILGGNLLKPSGLLVIEHGKRDNYSDDPCFREMRHYGAVHFSFFTHSDAENDGQ